MGGGSIDVLEHELFADLDPEGLARDTVSPGSQDYLPLASLLQIDAYRGVSRGDPHLFDFFKLLTTVSQIPVG